MRLLFSLFFVLILLGCTSDYGTELIQNPAGKGASLPRLFTDNSGAVFMSWVEESGEEAALFYSSYEDETWSDPEQIAASESWFVNWADFPSLITNNGSPVAAHWLNKIPGNTYSYNVEVSPFNGSEFQKSFNPHNDSTATEHGFVSMQPLSDSTFYVIWLDGRKTSGGHHAEFGDLSQAMTLRGALIHKSGRIIEETEIDNSVCDCCNTSLSLTGDGLLAVYRNRTEKEIRDIYAVKYADGRWGDPVPVFEDGWEIAACPVNGPSTDVIGSDAVAAYFTAEGEKSVVKIAFSHNGGESFRHPFVLDAENPLGRVDIVLKNKSQAWVSWMSRTEKNAALKIQLITSTGEVIQNQIISEMSRGRSSGFPQISRYKDGLLIAWTDIAEDNQKSIKTAILR